MKLDAVLRASGLLRVERPPALWEVEGEDVAVVRLLGEMIAVGLARGNELSGLVLNAANVTVEGDEADRPPFPADYVALTLRGRGDWGREATWSPEEPGEAVMANGDLDLAARRAGFRFAYLRSGEGEGSLTVFLPRAPARGAP